MSRLMTEQAALITSFKNLSYVIVFIATVEWLGFDPFAITVFTILMTIDVITGIIRTCVNEGCRSVKSSIGIHGVLSKLLLLVALFSMAITGKAVGFDMRTLAAGAVNILIIAELYSILGNIHSARSGTKKVEFDAVSFLLAKVKEMLRKVLMK